MVTKTLALAVTIAFGALALEVVFGLHLGIQSWVHGLIGDGHISLVQTY